MDIVNNIKQILTELNQNIICNNDFTIITNIHLIILEYGKNSFVDGILIYEIDTCNNVLDVCLDETYIPTKISEIIISFFNNLNK